MEDLLVKIDSLEKQINLVQNNVNFSLALTWAILGVVVAIIGIALYFLAKTWFNKKFTEETQKFDEKIKEFVKKNPQYFSCSGVVYLRGTNMLQGNKVKIAIMENRDLEIGCTNKLDLKPLNGNKILRYNAKVVKGYLEIEFRNIEPDFDLGFEWHLMYINKIYE